MRRLQAHRQKQFKTKVIALVVILFLVLYFIFSVGIRLLLNASVFIANLTAKKTTNQQAKSEDIFGSIDVDTIPTATNSARIVISGSVTNLSMLQFYLNGEKVKEISISTSDAFSEEIGDLIKGTNTVYLKGSLKDSKNTKQTREFIVLFKPDKPKLQINEPADKSKTGKSEIQIKGSTDKETFIKINDLPVVVDAQGNFTATVQLKIGDNSFTITASDLAGNSEVKTLTVTYQKD